MTSNLLGIHALLALLFLSGCGEPRRVTVAPAGPFTTVSPDAALQADLRTIFAGPQFERSLWSVLVRSVSSTDDLFALNSTKLVMPASTMKILTAAAAAEVLGWDYRFETRLVATAPLESGILRGDLIVIGGGDPSISERSDDPATLKSLARQLREADVRRIEGGIVGDDDLFDDKGWGDGWTLDNLPYGYSAPVGALEYNEGSVDLIIRAGAAAGDPVAVQVKPEGGLQVENQLVTVSETGTGMLTLQRLPGASRLIVHGQIPAKAAPFARTASVDNPTEFFARALRIALASEGIPVAGDAIDIDDFTSKPDMSNARAIATRQSPPLSQLITSMMKVSQNQYAEMLLKAIGSELAAAKQPAKGTAEAELAAPKQPAKGTAEAELAAPKQPAKGTAEAGRARVREVLRGFGIADEHYVMADGSGLSRYNYVTSDALVRILQQLLEREAHGSIFPSTLPIAGRDGTLARRLVGTPAEGKVRAKTGTVDNVRAMCGYVLTADGETLVFSVIANNFNVPAAEIDAAVDRVLIRLATFSRK